MERKFKVGNFVKNSNGEIGVVEWTSNSCMGIAEEDGYLGISLKTGTQGFASGVYIVLL